MFGTLGKNVAPLETCIGANIVPNIRRVMKKPVKLLGGYSQILPSNWKLYMENTKDSYHASLLHMFFTTFRLNRLSQKGGLVVSESGANHISYSMAADTAGKEYEQAEDALGAGRFRAGGAGNPEIRRRIRRRHRPADPVGISRICPAADPQQPRGAAHRAARASTAPNWCGPCSAFEDDDADEWTELRMQQSNLVGPAGFISMEDGAATGFVQRGARGARTMNCLSSRWAARASGRKKAASRKPLCVGFWNILSRSDGDCLMETTRENTMELQFKVQDLNARYIEAIDDDRLEAWPNFFRRQVSLPDHDRRKRSARAADWLHLRHFEGDVARPDQGAAASQRL